MNLDDLRASKAAVVTVTQATSILRDLDGNTLDERTVRRACREGQLPCIRVGVRLLIPREAFLALFTAPNTPDMSPPTGAVLTAASGETRAPRPTAVLSNRRVHERRDSESATPPGSVRHE